MVKRDSGLRGAPGAPSPNTERGRPFTGRIAAITRGRGDGYIQAKGERFYFVLRDVLDQEFNNLKPGDAVTFEAIDDSVSGHRAVRVKKTTKETDPRPASTASTAKVPPESFRNRICTGGGALNGPSLSTSESRP